MKRMLSLPLAVVAALLLLQGACLTLATTDVHAGTPALPDQPVIVAWDRVGTPVWS